MLWGLTVWRRYNRKIRNFFIAGVTLHLGRVSRMLQVGTKVHCPLLSVVMESAAQHGEEEVRAVPRELRSSRAFKA